MCKAAEVGKIVVNKCLSKGLSINAQKLQKLLVLMQLECIQQTGKELFKEDIVIWRCGVAIKEVDAEFSADAIYFSKPQTEFINLLEKEEKVVDNIIEKYGTYSAVDINQLPVIEELMPLGKTATQVPHISSKTMKEKYAQR